VEAVGQERVFRPVSGPKSTEFFTVDARPEVHFRVHGDLTADTVGRQAHSNGAKRAWSSFRAGLRQPRRGFPGDPIARGPSGAHGECRAALHLPPDGRRPNSV